MKNLHFFGCGKGSTWYNEKLIVGQGKTRGGAVFFENQNCFNLMDGLYLFNHVQMDGGGIYLLDCHDVLIKGNFFSLNFAKWGGAIYLERCSNVVIQNNLFLLNFAKRDGGAISLSKCRDILISENRFVLNTAFRSGGKIDIHECEKVNVL